MDDRNESDVVETQPEPLPCEPENELLDWEAYIPPPPPKRRGTIQVRLCYKGRGKPLPVAEPDEE
jgi:hypothetical protein